MAKPEYLDQLIDLASKAAGSDYKLAAELDTSRQAISNWRHGHKTCPVADQTLMAAIAGLEPQAWLARAVVSQYHGEKAVKLQRALKKSLSQFETLVNVRDIRLGQPLGFATCLSASEPLEFA